LSDKSPKVIAVSGIAGAGKSTLVQGLCGLLHNASILYYDAYGGLAKWWPAYVRVSLKANIARWVQDGGDPNLYVSIPQLVVDLERLKSGRSIDMPRPSLNVGHVSPTDFILLEEPFGRSRFEINKLVDFSVHLDLLADIALGRAVLREKKSGGDPVALVERHLREGLSDFFRMQATAGKQSADLVLDTTLPEHELITSACKAIQDHFSEA
jgi:uridine kinase